MKITKENQHILKRLQEKGASYNVSKWQREEDERKKILKNICEYPLVDKIDTQSSLMMQPDFIIKKKKTSASTGNAFYKKKGYTNPNRTSMAPPQIY